MLTAVSHLVHSGPDSWTILVLLAGDHGCLDGGHQEAPIGRHVRPRNDTDSNLESTTHLSLNHWTHMQTTEKSVGGWSLPHLHTKNRWTVDLFDSRHPEVRPDEWGGGGGNGGWFGLVEGGETGMLLTRSVAQQRAEMLSVSCACCAQWDVARARQIQRKRWQLISLTTTLLFPRIFVTTRQCTSRFALFEGSKQCVIPSKVESIPLLQDRARLLISPLRPRDFIFSKVSKVATSIK